MKYWTIVWIGWMVGSCGCGKEIKVETIIDKEGIKIQYEYYEDESRHQLAHGFFTKYYKSGKIMEAGNFKDDKADGQWMTYYENGKIQHEKHFKDMILNGRWIKYYENGKIQEEGNFKDGKAVGEWFWYNNNGELIKEIDCLKEPELCEG